MKNINWSNIITIAVVATLAVIFIVPRVKPLLAKLPVVGKYLAA